MKSAVARACISIFIFAARSLACSCLPASYYIYSCHIKFILCCIDCESYVVVFCLVFFFSIRFNFIRIFFPLVSQFDQFCWRKNVPYRSLLENEYVGSWTTAQSVTMIRFTEFIWNDFSVSTSCGNFEYLNLKTQNNYYWIEETKNKSKSLLLLIVSVTLENCLIFY